MLAKTIRRVVLIFPTIILISLLAFTMLYFSPGDTAMLILKERTNVTTITNEDIKEFEESKGLNAGYFTLYASWFGGVLKGDLGTSYVDGQSINSDITTALNKTLKMSLIAWAVYTIAGTAVGMLAAIYHNRILDKTTKYWSVMSTAIPVFWIGLFAVWLFSVKLGVITTVGKRSDFSLIFPGILMGIIYTGNLIIIVKEKTQLVLEEPFVLSARSLGVRKSRILRSHVLRNILAPVIATSTLAFSDFIGASVLMENIFSISGFGTLLTDAIRVKDFMVVASGTLILGVLVCTVNMLADITYCSIDRRAETNES
ncbi:MAG: ABC transporter permease [Lachnospiraceae bacterium]